MAYLCKSSWVLAPGQRIAPSGNAVEVIGRPGEGMVDGEVEESGGEVLHMKEEEEKGEEEEMEMTVEEEMLLMTALRLATRKEAKPPANISARI